MKPKKRTYRIEFVVEDSAVWDDKLTENTIRRARWFQSFFKFIGVAVVSIRVRELKGGKT